jgi:hypothetical protein
MKYEKNVVIYKGKPILALNSMLIKRQKISDEQLETIKDLHIQRILIEESFTLGSICPKDYREAWKMNQFYLQEAWGFKKDENFHRFWDMKGCSCPHMDNNDSYPTGHYTYSSTCPIHGELVKV